MMPAGPAGSEPDCVPPAERLAGVGSLVSHWDSAVPSCLWGCGDEILMGWWLLWSSRRTRRYWGFPQLQCSFELPWQWGGWGGRQVLSHKLTKSSGTLIKINIKQKCFSDWTIKYSRSFSEVSYPVSKYFSQNFVCSRGKPPKFLWINSFAEENHFIRKFLTSYYCTTLVLHLPVATIRSWWLHFFCTDEKRACVGIDFNQHRSVTESTTNT